MGIAEGIEEQEQVSILRMHNCNHGQGYFFSCPVPKQQFEHFLVSNSEHTA